MQTRYHKALKKPTEIQKKFFERNRLIVPPRARAVEDSEANQVGELLARIPLSNGVAIRTLPFEGVCLYTLSINSDLLKENPV